MDKTASIARILGIMLLIGFIMPFVGGDEVIFFNLEGLGEESISSTMKVQLIYPLIGGIAALVLAGLPGKKRSIGLIITAILPLLIFLDDRDIQDQLRRMMSEFSPSASGSNMILSILAVVGLLAGAHAYSVQPKNKIAPILAAVGGGISLLLLLIPVNGMMEELSGIPLIAPIKVLGLESDGAVITGLVMIASMTLSIIASIFAIQLATNKSNPDGARGTSVLIAWISSNLVFGVLILYFMIEVADETNSGEILMAMVFGLIKVLCWITGLLLLLPLGISDTITSYSPASCDESSSSLPPSE